jgi:hypothetical protein
MDATPPPELTAAGEIALAEHRYARAQLSRRIFGWRRFGPWVLAAVIATTAVASVLADRLVSPSGDLRALFALCAFLVLASFELAAYQRWSRRAQLAIWSARGRIEPEPARFSIGDDGFRADHGAISTLVGWPALSEIIPARRHWLFVGGALVYCVPRRFFTDDTAERAFIGGALARMSPPARARSREAAAFAAGA